MRRLFIAAASAAAALASAQAANAQEAYLSEVREMAANFCPRGWAPASGQTLPINQNTALFSLLGTRYGGDGRTTFQLPNLQAAARMSPLPDGAEPARTIVCIAIEGIFPARN